MDSYQATKMLFSRIQTLDPENASKIMGYILIQDHGEKELIRLALGPDPFLHQLILKAKSHLGISISSSNPALQPCNPISRPNPLRVSNNGFYPSSPSSNQWPLSPISPPSSLSYASTVNGIRTNSVPSPLSSAFTSFKTINSTTNFVDDYQLQDHLSFLNDVKTDDLFDLGLNQKDNGSDCNMHKRSCSVPGPCLGSEDVNSSGFGWKPCLYFARGFCKNGSSCRFFHGGSFDAAAAIGCSPSKLSEFEQCEELLRSKSLEQQKQAIMAAGASFPYNKCMDFLVNNNDAQRSAAAAALMAIDELPELGRFRSERSSFSAMGLVGMMNPGSRQIYLTFTADSTFREEDVSNYFSIYGPVQDVRIPYQQKRMFGFVTFVYPDTVKLILAKGNPHFVCDSRVLVKPYKEKGKIPERKQQHNNQLDMGEYSSCLSPSGLNSREPFDLSFGAKMLYNTQEMLLRRKLEEQVDLQQAIEFQGRSLMNLQLLDLKNQHYGKFQHSLPVGSPTPSPTLSHNPSFKSHEFLEEINGSPPAGIPQIASVDADYHQQQEINAVNINGNGFIKDEVTDPETSDLQESSEHILPDSPFFSPKKSAGDHPTVLSMASSSSNNSPLIPPMCTSSMASHKSCYLQLPRLSSGRETIM